MASAVEVASFLGILLIIATSYVSLVRQRRESVRASLEQLDDIRLPAARDVKIRAILYRCRGLLVRGRCEVKFKLYGAETPGASVPADFVEFPPSVFDDHEYRAEADGYVVTFDTNNPVAVRRDANEMMLAMCRADHVAVAERPATTVGDDQEWDDEVTERS